MPLWSDLRYTPVNDHSCQRTREQSRGRELNLPKLGAATRNGCENGGVFSRRVARTALRKEKENGRKHPASDHHNNAASHHENAARSHREAAKSYDEDKHETGAHHAQSARGHSSRANEESENASRKHADTHSKSK